MAPSPPLLVLVSVSRAAGKKQIKAEKKNKSQYQKQGTVICIRII